MTRRLLKWPKQSTRLLSGEALMADFISTITNLVTTETAHYVAEKTEREALSTIKYAGSSQHQAAYVRPEDIDPDLQTTIVRSSLDAHLQKAQAEQIASLTKQQLATTEQADRRYVGKKVKVSVVDSDFKPFETFWWNSRTGDYDKGETKLKNIKGTIDDLSLAKNLLVIKPSLGGRLLMPQRKYIAVYVINPNTLLPAVKLALI